ncbi:unnamed protein product [Phytomonas sp. Hart1]|nr:unnamed protein product [Phytomonas sp. Hart1]|eukprot:CCW67018.1 unnamed protein product [Phytomonas sp. isolate Hart1]
MKICVMGYPIEDKIFLEVTDSDEFENIFPEIEKKVNKESLWSRYLLYSAVMGEKGSRAQSQPLLHLIRPEDTLASLKKAGKRTYAFVLRPIGGSKLEKNKLTKAAYSPNHIQRQSLKPSFMSEADSQSCTEGGFNLERPSTLEIPQAEYQGKKTPIRDLVNKNESEQTIKCTSQDATSGTAQTNGAKPLSVSTGLETMQFCSVEDMSKFQSSGAPPLNYWTIVQVLNEKNENSEGTGHISCIKSLQIAGSLPDPIPSDSIPSVSSRKTVLNMEETCDEIVPNSSESDKVAIPLEGLFRYGPNNVRSLTKRLKEESSSESFITPQPSGFLSMAGSEPSELAPRQPKVDPIVNAAPAEEDNINFFMSPIQKKTEISLSTQFPTENSDRNDEKLLFTLKRLFFANSDAKESPGKFERTDNVTVENKPSENTVFSEIPINNWRKTHNSEASSVCIVSEKHCDPAGQRCVEDLFSINRENLNRCYFQKWLAFRDDFVMNQTFEKRLERVKTPKTQQTTQYPLRGKVESPDIVSNLFDNMQQLHDGNSNEMNSNEFVGAFRSMINALKQCFKNGVAEVAFNKTLGSSQTFISQWQHELDLCSVQDASKLSNAMYQAAHLLDQLANLVKFTRKQTAHQDKFKGAQQPTQDNMRLFEYFQSLLNKSESDKCRVLQYHLDKAIRREQLLRGELELALRSHQTVGSTDPFQTTGSTKKTTQDANLMQRVASMEKKETEIIRLHQSLAKARVEMEHLRSCKARLRQKEEEATELQAQLRRVRTPQREPIRPSSTRALSSGHRSRDPSLQRTPRAGRDHPSPPSPEHSVARVLHSVRGSPLQRRRGEAQEPPLVVRPRRATPERSLTPPPLPVVKQGLCPNCQLGNLIVLSLKPRIALEEQAAFCRSCRQSFTFGDLGAKVGIVEPV